MKTVTTAEKTKERPQVHPKRESAVCVFIDEVSRFFNIPVMIEGIGKKMQNGRNEQKQGFRLVFGYPTACVGTSRGEFRS